MTVTGHLSASLAEQLDWHWSRQLRPHLDGLTDDEYFWEPVPHCWSVRPDGGIDFTFPIRNHSHFGGPPADYQSWPYALHAATALEQLDDAYRAWIDGVSGLDDYALHRPVGPAEGSFADRPMIDLVLHINREVIHHGAEIACIRDLFIHQKGN